MGLKENLVVSAVLVITLVSFAIYFTPESTYVKSKNLFRDTIKTEVYALEADGFNFRYYSFDAPENKDWACFAAVGETKGGAACYPKKRNK